ncbi:HAD family hydrolase [Streptomyces sp. NPDC016309]|uniref:HAD family hydrolase n=1 Tax=Streptomyces sp. NPDC016309 TaxID=3364965 RepID=UPI0036F92806
MTDLAPAHRLWATRAVVFDTDGVITDTARVHAAAWKAAFDAHLRARAPRPAATPPSPRPPAPQDAPRPAAAPAGDPRFAPFDEVADYLRYVDGKSRLDGAAAFLAARGTAPSPATVRAVAAEKERLFTELLRERGVRTFPGTVRLVRALRGAGVPVAAVSASRHAREVLAAARVADLFDVCVDGDEAARLRLPGKPDPALFLEAARRLAVPPARCAVAEDALAGVEAGRRGGFGLVVGVDRAAGPTTGDALRRAGADLVVHDLAELLPAPREGVPS